MKKLGSLFLLAPLLISSASLLTAQETFPRNGVADHREGKYAFINATIFQTWDEKLEDATMVIFEGEVAAIGTGIIVPRDAVIIDCEGKTIYPSFIDLYSDYGLPEVEKQSSGGWISPTQFLTDKPGAYAWNEALKPEFDAHEVFSPDKKMAEKLHKTGFGAVLSHQMDGISRGSSVLVTLTGERAHEAIVKERVAHHLSFRRGQSSMRNPSSLMGAIALIRQTYYDGKWYGMFGKQEEINLSLQAWNDARRLVQVFEVGDKLEALRAAKIAEEFDFKYILKGNGDEYQRLNEIKATGSPLILPLNFPEAMDVEDPFDALNVNLTDLKHWELAPANPARVAAAGIPFALTQADLPKKADFMENVRKAIAHGLSEAEALKALTHTPASFAKALDKLGSLQVGRIANFIITDGSVFSKKTKIHHNWVNGKLFIISDLQEEKLEEGQYALQVSDMMFRVEISGGNKAEIVTDDSTKTKVKANLKDGALTLTFTPKGEENSTRLSGTRSADGWAGRGQEGSGNWVDWSLARTGDLEKKEKKSKNDEDDSEEDQTTSNDLGKTTYPFLPYGWTERPQAGVFLLKNATVWTCEEDGILENTDVLLRDGKIAEIGENLSAGSATVIDATGRHITPGIVDEHTHIAASRGINEGTQASSAEVRIGDVVNSEDINIYRQLSGGVTCAQILHGSANPIGGQSAVIKFRWGFSPEEMKYEHAKPFIKFALGENVKRSRSSNNNRFPNTRMGVAQVYEDHFTEAKKYGERKRSGETYRVDLELECLDEILRSERFITCHSYRQSEINMLMKVAEKFGFRVNTFTHILEGYKVADKMAGHGAGGSTFSDWWAYKFEVYEAIPHNGAVMHEQGVTVAFNSDDAEMARRLNQEAAKAVRFGGVSEEEALKFVTINPARLLRIDGHTGSLKVGKDADVVIWSDNPLSIYAKADATFVDGIKFFDREVDLKLREEVAAERNRLIQKMLAVKKEGGEIRKPGWKKERHYHCDSEGDEGQ